MSYKPSDSSQELADLHTLPQLAHLVMHDVNGCLSTLHYLLGGDDCKKMIDPDTIQKFNDAVNNSLSILRKFGSALQHYPRHDITTHHLGTLLDDILLMPEWRWQLVRKYTVSCEMSGLWVIFKQSLLPVLHFLNDHMPMDRSSTLTVSTEQASGSSTTYISLHLDVTLDTELLRSAFRPFKEGLSKPVDIDMLIACSLNVVSSYRSDPTGTLIRLAL